MAAASATPSSLLETASGIRLALLSSRFESLVRTMMNTLFRTGRSGVLNTAKDFSCCVLTADHQLLATAESLPIHVLSGPDHMARVMAEIHDDLAPGDAFLHNSPYHGNSHAADHSLLVPVFDDGGQHRYTVLAKAHLADCGNARPTTYDVNARDVYEEGALIFPCVRVQRDREHLSDIIRMCQLRIRVPELWWGDYLALLGAARIGEQLVAELGAEVGWETLDAFASEWFDYSERSMISAIGELTAGEAIASSRHDPVPAAPDGLEITAKVTIDAEAAMLAVDLTDNPPCLPFGLNLTEATARTAAYLGLFNSLAPVPVNAGSFRRIDVRLKDDCCVGIPRHPASCSVATTNLADRVTNAVQHAIAEISPGSGMAEIGGGVPPAVAVVSGNDPRHGQRPYVDEIFLVTTGGAGSPKTDGWLTTSHGGCAGMMNIDSVEIDELRLPLRVYEQRVVPDTEGAGEHRGAPSVRVVYGPTESPMQIDYVTDGTVNPAEGVAGGQPGAPGTQARRDAAGKLHPLPPSGPVTLQKGEAVVSTTPAGGGYGPAADRDPASVDFDIAEGWISRQRAADSYGVETDSPKEGSVQNGDQQTAGRGRR